MKKVTLFLGTACLLFALNGSIQAQIGKTVSNVKLADPNDNPKEIPDLGSKIVMVIYTDPDVKDVNDPLSDAITAKAFPKDKYRGLGIANCKDTWIPNAGIRMKSRQKEKQFPGTVILLDVNNYLPKAWGLSVCDEAGVVVIIGKDKKIKYIKYVKTQEESKAITPEVIKIISEGING
jgi:predicted transcriptional regulator